MPFPKKEHRNRELVQKREGGWTFRALAAHYHIDVRAAWEIYDKYKEVYGKNGR